MSSFCVLVVEDDAALRQALCETLEIGGFDVVGAADGPKAIDILEQHAISLVVSDIQMEPWDGLELLARIRRRHAEVPMVLMTAFASVPQAVEAIRRGALDYLVKPVEAGDLLDLAARFRDGPEDDAELIAEDPRSRRLAALAERVARADVNVLLTGPSGSGKEAYARFIHRVSDRRAAPFVAVNCAAIPDSMLEAELFGHDKGAFTGAVQSRAGKFESAEGGTLLLDEISEMDLGLQAKLLRVLQEREVERLGSNRLIPLDVRVIATSNRNLSVEVAEGRFREDLYYRLNVFPLHLPPLRERPGDIVPLAMRSLTAHGRRKARPAELAPDAAERLKAHDWPGNVRELDNVMQRAMVLAPTASAIRAQDLFFEAPPRAGATGGSAGRSGAESGASLHDEMEEREADAIVSALREEGGHRERTAQRLGISPRTLRYKLSRMRKAGVAIPGEATGRRPDSEHAG